MATKRKKDDIADADEVQRAKFFGPPIGMGEDGVLHITPPGDPLPTMEDTIKIVPAEDA